MDELFTRCPTCKTVFRTHEDQLSVQSGKVRCGHCRMVFDGRAHLVDLTPWLTSRAQEDALGPPTVTLRRAMDLSPVPAEEQNGAAEERFAETGTPVGNQFSPPLSIDYATIRNPGEDPAVSRAVPLPSGDATTDGRGKQPAEGRLVPLSADEATMDGREALPPANQPEASHADDDVTPYRWQRTRELSRGARWTYGLLSVLFLIVLSGQLGYHFRHAVAANEPSLRPHLVAACRALGCSIEPLRNKDDITIESHDLQADPAHQGLLILQTTMRNRAAHAVAFPHLELELDDIAGQPVVRKVFAPTEYAGGAADFVNGIPAHGEWNIKLFLDASGVGAGGYNLYLFYP
ncbi:MAG: zinc-ribbon and DUF3426 domain-containing protein [Betaproteobacteria bacterium]